MPTINELLSQANQTLNSTSKPTFDSKSAIPQTIPSHPAANAQTQSTPSSILAPTTTQLPMPFWKKALIGVIIIILLLVIGLAVYLLVKKKSGKNEKKISNESNNAANNNSGGGGSGNNGNNGGGGNNMGPNKPGNTKYPPVGMQIPQPNFYNQHSQGMPMNSQGMPMYPQNMNPQDMAMYGANQNMNLQGMMGHPMYGMNPQNMPMNSQGMPMYPQNMMNPQGMPMNPQNMPMNQHVGYQHEQKPVQKVEKKKKKRSVEFSEPTQTTSSPHE